MSQLIDVYFAQELFENRKSKTAILVDIQQLFHDEEIFQPKQRKSKDTIKQKVIEEVIMHMGNQFEAANFHVPGFTCGSSQGGLLLITSQY
jgi:hypothetical protein